MRKKNKLITAVMSLEFAKNGLTVENHPEKEETADKSEQKRSESDD
jgi:hypothetical protein